MGNLNQRKESQLDSVEHELLGKYAGEVCDVVVLCAVNGGDTEMQNWESGSTILAGAIIAERHRKIYAGRNKYAVR